MKSIQIKTERSLCQNFINIISYDRHFNRNRNHSQNGNHNRNKKKL